MHNTYRVSADTLREKDSVGLLEPDAGGSLVCERQQHEPWRLILLFKQTSLFVSIKVAAQIVRLISANEWGVTTEF